MIRLYSESLVPLLQVSWFSLGEDVVPPINGRVGDAHSAPDCCSAANRWDVALSAGVHERSSNFISSALDVRSRDRSEVSNPGECCRKWSVSFWAESNMLLSAWLPAGDAVCKLELVTCTRDTARRVESR